MWKKMLETTTKEWRQKQNKKKNFLEKRLLIFYLRLIFLFKFITFIKKPTNLLVQ
jgi:hypothetical protein